MLFFKMRQIFKRKKKETTTIQRNAIENTIVGTSSARPAQVHRSDHLQSIKKMGGKRLVPDTSELNEKLKRQRERVENKPPSPPARTKSMQPKTDIKRNISHPKPAPRLSLPTSKRRQPTPAPRKTSRQPVVALRDQPTCFDNIVIGGVKLPPIDEGNIHEGSNNHEEKTTLFL